MRIAYLDVAVHFIVTIEHGVTHDQCRYVARLVGRMVAYGARAKRRGCERLSAPAITASAQPKQTAANEPDEAVTISDGLIAVAPQRPGDQSESSNVSRTPRAGRACPVRRNVIGAGYPEFAGRE